jgi:hypothetical protein
VSIDCALINKMAFQSPYATTSVAFILICIAIGIALVLACRFIYIIYEHYAIIRENKREDEADAMRQQQRLSQQRLMRKVPALNKSGSRKMKDSELDMMEIGAGGGGGVGNGTSTKNSYSQRYDSEEENPMRSSKSSKSNKRYGEDDDHMRSSKSNSKSSKVNNNGRSADTALTGTGNNTAVVGERPLSLPLHPGEKVRQLLAKNSINSKNDGKNGRSAENSLTESARKKSVRE